MADINEKVIDEEKTEEKNGLNIECGKFILSVPIRSRSEDLTELYYDFGAISQKEYIEAMDSDRDATNPFRISHKQAFNLFAAAAAKVTDGVDAIDIRERMSAKDAIYATQIASLFFVQQTQAAANRAVRG